MSWSMAASRFLPAALVNSSTSSEVGGRPVMSKLIRRINIMSREDFNCCGAAPGFEPNNACVQTFLQQAREETKQRMAEWQYPPGPTSTHQDPPGPTVRLP